MSGKNVKLEGIGTAARGPPAAKTTNKQESQKCRGYHRDLPQAGRVSQVEIQGPWGWPQGQIAVAQVPCPSSAIGGHDHAQSQS